MSIERITLKRKIVSTLIFLSPPQNNRTVAVTENGAITLFPLQSNKIEAIIDRGLKKEKN